MVIMVHCEVQGKMMSMLLDIVEVAESHTGVALTAAFAKVLDDFRIGDKVSKNCD